MTIKVNDHGILCYKLEESIFEVDFTFRILRFLAILSIMVIFAAFMVGLVGADFTKCYENVQRKRNMMIWSGILMICAGMIMQESFTNFLSKRKSLKK